VYAQEASIRTPEQMCVSAQIKIYVYVLYVFGAYLDTQICPISLCTFSANILIHVYSHFCMHVLGAYLDARRRIQPPYICQEGGKRKRISFHLHVFGALVYKDMRDIKACAEYVYLRNGEEERRRQQRDLFSRNV
jgi:hypothetical protein